MNIFGWLEQITYHKKPWSSFSEEDKTSFNPFMINRFISMREDYIDLVNLISKYQYLPNKKLYEFYCNTLPTKKTFFLPGAAQGGWQIFVFSLIFEMGP